MAETIRLTERQRTGAQVKLLQIEHNLEVIKELLSPDNGFGRDWPENMALDYARALDDMKGAAKTLRKVIEANGPKEKK